jgi:hypothetical protein
MNKNMDSIVEIYHCDCNPNKHYKTKQTFKKHFDTKKHQLFEKQSNQINYARKVQQLEIELKKITKERDIWKEKYMEIHVLDLKLKKE